MSFTMEQGRGVDKFTRQTILRNGAPYTIQTTWCILRKLEREMESGQRYIRFPLWVIERELQPLLNLVTNSAVLSPACRGRRQLRVESEVTCEVPFGVGLPDYPTAAFYQFRIDLSRVSSGQGEDGSTIAILPRLIEVDHFRL